MDPFLTLDVLVESRDIDLVDGPLPYPWCPCWTQGCRPCRRAPSATTPSARGTDTKMIYYLITLFKLTKCRFLGTHDFDCNFKNFCEASHEMKGGKQEEKERKRKKGKKEKKGKGEKDNFVIKKFIQFGHWKWRHVSSTQENILWPPWKLFFPPPLQMKILPCFFYNFFCGHNLRVYIK